MLLSLPNNKLIDAIPLPTIIVNSKTEKIELANDASLNYFSFNREKLLGSNYRDLFVDEAPNLTDLIHRTNVESYNSYCGNYDQVSGSNELFKSDIFGRYFHVQNDSYLFLTFQYTTAISKKNNLNESFFKVSEATNDVLWDWDLTERRLIWGRRVKKVFGYPARTLKFELSKWAKWAHPDDESYVVNSLKMKVNNKRAKNWMSKYRFKKSNGEYALVINKGKIIRDEYGQAVRILGAITDLTDQEERKRDLVMLSQDLKKYASQLEIINDELRQFTYIASHDLQEPVRMISNFLDRLEKNYGDDLDEKAQQYVRFALDGSLRMRRVIMDLLEYSRAGKLDNKLEEVNLNEIVDNFCLLRKEKIISVSAKIQTFDLPSKFLTYKAPLTQVFHSILDNALKYCSLNESCEIDISSEDIKTHLLVKVRDNGIGINPKFHDKIFTIFQRLHNREEYEGTGIGLSIAKKSVKSLRGEIWVESEEKKGTTFYFTILKENE